MIREVDDDVEDGRLAVSIPEAARMLGIGRTLAFELAARGELPTLTLGGRRLVNLNALRRMVEDRTNFGAARVHGAAENATERETAGCRTA